MSSDLYLKDKIEFNISTLEGSRLWGLDTVLNCQNAGLVFRTTTDPVFSAATFPPPHQHHPTSQKFPNSWSNQKRRQHSSVDLQVDLLCQYFALQGQILDHLLQQPPYKRVQRSRWGSISEKFLIFSWTKTHFDLIGFMEKRPRKMQLLETAEFTSQYFNTCTEI